MFHLLSGSSPATTRAIVSEYDEDGRLGEGDGRSFKSSSVASPSCSSSYSVTSSNDPHTSCTPNNHHNKKRSRRRRKGKSRSKVEPISSSCKKSPTNASANNATNKKQHDAPMTKRDIYFALDCEMVGVGPDGLNSAVGRVTIVNWENQIVLDTYVKVPAPVTDYRTHISGITKEMLQPRPGHSLMTFTEVREKVQSILRGKILIGHGLENDLKALGLYHPWTDIRDTATYSLYMREFRDPVTQCVTLAPKKLRDLAWEKLGRQIQVPGVPHSPVEDAIAALDLYKEVRGQWEDHLIRLAQQKDNELMERRRQLEQEEQQRQQQQMQMRRFQWFQGAAPPQPMPYHPQQQQHPMAHPIVPSPTFRYQSGMPPNMMGMHAPPPPPQQNPMRSSSSSWFGFSRRPKQQPSRIPTAPSIDSVPTMTTVQSSFSQDYSSRGAWYVREEEFDEYPRHRRMTVDTAQETIEEVEASPLDDLHDLDSQYGEHTESTMSVTEVPTECASPPEPPLPTDYEPPRYFTNPDPDPKESSSWFKLGWGRKDKDSSTRGDDSDVEMDEDSEKARRSSHSDTLSALFSSRLFPRRNSENCLSDMCEKVVDVHSRSLH